MTARYTADEIFALSQKNWPETHHSVHKYVLYFHRLRDIVVIEMNEFIKQFGLSIAEFDVLATLRSSSFPYVLKPSELQSSTLLSSGGLTKLLYQLEARELIKRSIVKEDKRSKLAHLTAKGKALIETSRDAVMMKEKERLDDALSNDELNQLTKLLGKLLNVVENRL